MSYKAKNSDVAFEEGGKPPSLPCRTCQTITDHKTLCSLGGLCFSCYAAWRRAIPKDWPYIGDKAKDGPKAWASALRKRELLGERLTPFQRQAWRDAIGSQAGEVAQ